MLLTKCLSETKQNQQNQTVFSWTANSAILIIIFIPLLELISNKSLFKEDNTITKQSHS